jgi:uncharacterized protein (DUF2141 family)
MTAAPTSRWPRSFHFAGVPDGEYAVLAFVDTQGNETLTPAADAAGRPLQPRGWYSRAGVDEVDAEVSSVRLGEAGEDAPWVRIVLRQPPPAPAGSRL